jgi:hypothetical protein
MYTLKVTEEQLLVIEQAAHLLARCSMGQFDHILWGVHNVASKCNAGEARRNFDDASDGLFGSGTGIANCDAQGKRAWDLYQVVRKQLADDSGKEPDGTVRFREPYAAMQEPLAKVTRDA